MPALQRLSLSFLLAALTGPAWSAPYTIPGTNLPIDIRSSDPKSQFTSREIQQLLTALSLYPYEQLLLVKYVESRPGKALAPTEGTQDGGIIVTLTDAAS